MELAMTSEFEDGIGWFAMTGKFPYRAKRITADDLIVTTYVRRWHFKCMFTRNPLT